MWIDVMTQRDCILKLKISAKVFFDVPVLENVDLDIYAGEVHCLVGRKWRR
ncbi:hypothetical protein AAUPMC_13850, partial [Pasteurella multocida subsp. multocida str. Anand1_cattle]